MTDRSWDDGAAAMRMAIIDLLRCHQETFQIAAVSFAGTPTGSISTLVDDYIEGTVTLIQKIEIKK